LVYDGDSTRLFDSDRVLASGSSHGITGVENLLELF
jgi:hypothetical protein